MGLNWKLTETDMGLIASIVSRAKTTHHKIDALSLTMDITAVHLNDPDIHLDLEGLLNFDNFNFVHDIIGIIQHIDRNTGRIIKGFLPRCAR